MKPPFPDAAASCFDRFDGDDGAHAKLARFGLVLFLISLAMLFAASIVGYLVIRFTRHGDLPPGTFTLPPGLWVSTLILAAAGLSMWRATAAARRRALAPLRRALAAAWLLSIAFVAVQIPSLFGLIAQHQQLIPQRVGLYGFAFTLVVLHAVHVIGGLAPLSMLTVDAWQRRITLERLPAVQRCAMYWHFLEAVWLIMFLTMLIVG